ncbi:MAG: GGDEF domain-containing protein [Gammaproteobacteria bacterium]|nr:GGDEF domain-containing protein [Gammaproteobacteria bacterium]
MRKLDQLDAIQRLDPYLLARWIRAKRVMLACSGVLSVTVLLGWLFPVVGDGLPAGWEHMKVSTALSVLLGISAVLVIQPGVDRQRKFKGRVLLLLMMVLAGSALLTHWRAAPGPLETFLARGDATELPGTMSMQTAVFMLLFSQVIWIEWTATGVMGKLADAVTFLLFLMLVLFLCGYLFGSYEFISSRETLKVSVPTWFCMASLSFVAITRRVRSPLFSVVVGKGAGSRTARLIAPGLTLAPLLVIFLVERAIAGGQLSMAQGASVAATFLVAGGFLFVFWVGRKINSYEDELRMLAMVDSLTQLSNRRGLELVGEPLFRDALRNRRELQLMFFDLDGLKRVNDRLGHEAGSSLIMTFSEQLGLAFAEADLVARIGGDEFVALGDPAVLASALADLHGRLARINAGEDRSYDIEFSAGTSTLGEPGRGRRSFATLLEEADQAMYRDKRRKQVSRSRI